MISGPQIRGARGLLGWSRAQLSVQSSVSASAIGRFENGRMDPHDRTLAAIELALAQGGVKVIGSVGMQLRQQTVAQSADDAREHARAR